MNAKHLKILTLILLPLGFSPFIIQPQFVAESEYCLQRQFDLGERLHELAMTIGAERPNWKDEDYSGEKFAQP